MDILERLRRGILTESAEAMQAVAAEFVRSIQENRTIALSGDLGSGKTTFVKGAAVALGVAETVNSPSFNIYSYYQGSKYQLIHMDAYRLASSADFENLLLEEFMRPPWVLFIEWPEKILDALPENTLWLDFRIEKGKHRVCLQERR